MVSFGGRLVSFTVGLIQLIIITDTSQKTIKLIPLIFIVTVILTGCSSTGSREVKSKLEYLDGKNWDKSQFTIGNAQIPTRMKNIETVIEGSVYINEVVPLKFTTVYLIRNGSIVTETSTNHLGVFKLQGNIPNGTYLINVDSKPNSWNREIKIEEYVIKGLELNIN